MKTLRLSFVSVVLLLLCQLSNGQITGSAHDFSSVAWAPTNDQICVVCHTPHLAMNVADAPLWNHELSVATYTLYDSPTFDGTVGADLSSSSKLCLSCHDGTVALANFSGTTGVGTSIAATALVGSGGDMSNDHPISFTYNDALAITDDGLRPPTTTNSGMGSTITNDMLFLNMMECASCHDVHNQLGFPSLLKINNAASALCLTCHAK